MIYPKFPKKDDVIGICAPSAGVGHKIETFEQSLTVLRNEGYRIVESDSVRLNDLRGGDAKTRAHELQALFADPNIQVVMSAAGGDFLYEVLPHIDWQLLKDHPKWLLGMSDPTGILLPYTTVHDVATIYGMNAGSYRYGKSFRYIRESLEILSGQDIIQNSYAHIDALPPFNDEPKPKMTKRNRWHGNVDQLHVSGRCLVGCVDVMKDLMSTPYDGTVSFVERYKNDGLILCLDDFALSAENLYRTLLQMQYAGWFKNLKAVILGRVILPSSDTGMTYEDAMARVFGDRIPYLTNADIGHTLPNMTLINGAIMNLDYLDGKASIRFELK